jgi:hypothetical protein
MGNNINYLAAIQAGLLAAFAGLLGRSQALLGLLAAALLN